MNTADLYYTNSGFVIYYPFKNVNQMKIGYDDEMGLFSSLVDDKEPQVFLAKVSDFEPDGAHGKGVRYGHVTFAYDVVSRKLVCEASVDGVKNSFEISIVTRKQKWEDENPGPYTTIRIGDLYNCVNPCASLPYVYHDGSWMLSDPMEIDIITPVSREEDVRVFLSSTRKEFNVEKFEQASNDAMWPNSKGKNFHDTAQDIAKNSTYIGDEILYGEQL